MGIFEKNFSAFKANLKQQKIEMQQKFDDHIQIEDR
jgi:hypothetical protein